MSKQNNKQIKSILKKNLKKISGIKLVFIFGSFVTSNMKESSDIDIAILFVKPPDFFKILKIKDEISKHLNFDIDIVNLNTASPIIKMQVLKYGDILFDLDNKMYNDFFVKTVNEYDDIKQVRKAVEDNMLKGKMYA